MISRTLKSSFVKTLNLTLAASLAFGAMAPTAFAAPASDKNWKLKNVPLSKAIRVTSKSQAAGPAEAGAADVVTLAGGEKFDVSNELTAEYVKRDLITESEAQTLNEVRREVLQTTLRAALSEEFSGTLIANSSEGYVVTPSEAYTAGEASVTFNPIVSILQAPETPVSTDPAAQAGEQVPRSKFVARLKAFARFLNEAIIRSTVREFHSLKKHSKTVAHQADEVGISLNFKIELQLGVGSFNFSHNRGLVLDVGYNRKSHLVSLRTGMRQEQLGDGIGLPGVKFEVRRYMSVTDNGASKPVSAGHAWYPPAIPGLSLVVDSSDRYLAHGLAFGAGADILIPGTFLLNAVNDWKETEKRVTLFRIPDSVFEMYKTVVDTLLRRPRTCQAIFS